MKILYGILSLILFVASGAILYTSSRDVFDYQGIFIAIILILGAVLLIYFALLNRRKGDQLGQTAPVEISDPSAAKAVLMAVGVGMYALAASTALSPQISTSSGRWAFFTNFVYSQFGREGLIVFWLLIGTLAIGIVINKSKSN